MGLFYAYLKEAQGHTHYRHVVTFASRDTADEWWRIMSTSPGRHAASIRRVSPQFYTYDRSMISIPADIFKDELPDARPFIDKMFFAYISNANEDNPTAIPPIEMTDHISGGWYFIRSKADPWSHWYFRTDGACLVCGDANCDAIHVSSEYRTKFCVRVCNLPDDFRVPENFVMIGKDEVSIAAPMDHTLHIDDAGSIRATKGYQGGTDLLFKDLKNRFIARAKKQVNGEIWEYVVPVGRGLGEAWELVD